MILERTQNQKKNLKVEVSSWGRVEPPSQLQALHQGDWFAGIDSRAVVMCREVSHRSYCVNVLMCKAVR